MWKSCGGIYGFFGGERKLIRYPLKKIYEEVAFIAYYFHWPHEQIMNLEHRDRKKWCDEISKINRKMNGEKEKKNIFDVFND